MYKQQLRRIILIPTALVTIIVSFLAIATAIDLFRTVLTLNVEGFTAVFLVLLILLLAIAEFVVVFGIYYWLGASLTERRMARRASLAGVVFFPIMAVSSFFKVYVYMRLDMGFFDVTQITGAYPHVGVFLGAGGFVLALACYLLFNLLIRREERR